MSREIPHQILATREELPKLPHDLREAIHQKLMPKGLEARAKEFCELTENNIARVAVETLLQLKAAKGKRVAAATLPALLFKEVGAQISYTGSTRGWLEEDFGASFKEAMDEAITEMLIITCESIPASSNAKLTIEEKAYFINHYSDYIRPLPRFARAEYDVSREDYHRLVQVKSLGLEILQISENNLCGTSNTIALATVVEKLRATVRQRRQDNRNKIQKNSWRNYKLFHEEESTNLFERGFDAYLFRKLAAGKNVNEFIEAQSADTVDIDQILETILQHHHESIKKTPVPFADRFPALGNFPKLKKAFTAYIWSKTFAAIDKHQDAFFDYPSPSVEIDFLRTLGKKLGVTPNSSEQEQRQYLAAWNRNLFGTSKADMRKKLGTKVEDPNLIGLYEQALAIYKMDQSRALREANGDTSNIESMVAVIDVLLERLANAFLTYEVGMYTIDMDEIQKTARLFVSNNRQVMADLLANIEIGIRAEQEVDDITPGSR